MKKNYDRTYVTIGASNHTLKQRMKHDYYLKECCGCSDLKTAGTEMSDKVCGTCKYWSQMVCPDDKCTVLEDTCNDLREERDELKRSNHDKDVMIATLMYVIGDLK